MAYTVLARRYRSGTFDEVIGQDHVAQTLKKAIASGRVAHAYLFCGTRGVGKTSMARILAKALNCESTPGPTPSPCGKCNSCQAIARGDDLDVIEIDAASNTGVDNIRELIENSQYRPARSRFKVYIIDEVHMLSKSAFNALLKTLEEPPSHVKFILATTEPEKVLPTILSRCQRYDFRNISSREIAGHLKAICKQEQIKADDDALLLVAKAGAGSMRDSLSLLDRLLSVGEKNLTAEMIEHLLGLPRSQLLLALGNAIAGSDVKAVLVQTADVLKGGQSVDGLVAALVDHLRSLLIIRICGPDSDLVEAPGVSMAELAGQAERFDPVALTQDITILEELRRHIRQSQAGRALLDATLVRMALADQFSSIGELLGRVDDAPSAPRAATAVEQKKNDSGLRPGVTPPAASSPPLPPAIVPAAEFQEEISQLKSQLATMTSGAAKTEAQDLPQLWASLLKELAAHGEGVRSLISHGSLAGIEEDVAVIRFGSQHDTLVKMLDRNGKKEKVRDALSRVLSRNTGVRFEVTEAPAVQPSPGSPSEPVRPEPAAAPPAVGRVTQEMIDGLREAEPLVRTMMDQLGAVVVKVE